VRQAATTIILERCKWQIDRRVPAGDVIVWAQGFVGKYQERVGRCNGIERPLRESGGTAYLLTARQRTDRRDLRLYPSPSVEISDGVGHQRLRSPPIIAIRASPIPICEVTVNKQSENKFPTQEMTFLIRILEVLSGAIWAS
jgi:hypothetical protein